MRRVWRENAGRVRNSHFVTEMPSLMINKSGKVVACDFVSLYKHESNHHSRVGQFDFRPASFFIYNSAVSGRTTLKFDMGLYDSPVELLSKFGVNRTSLTMRVELGSNLQGQRKRVELSNPSEDN